MYSNFHKRSRSEDGFTLIELLVVMIIIAILMAVAVPTFLAQKNTALKTQATANIKQVINAIESCGAQLPSGGYTDGTLNCSTQLTLEGFEKSLRNLNIQATSPAASTTGVNQTHVALSGSGQGFIVQRVINDSGKWVFFYEVHTDLGDIIKGCGTTAGAVTATTAPTAGDGDTKTCKTGKW